MHPWQSASETALNCSNIHPLMLHSKTSGHSIFSRLYALCMGWGEEEGIKVWERGKHRAQGEIGGNKCWRLCRQYPESSSRSRQKAVGAALQNLGTSPKQKQGTEDEDRTGPCRYSRTDALLCVVALPIPIDDYSSTFHLQLPQVACLFPEFPNSFLHLRG